METRMLVTVPEAAVQLGVGRSFLYGLILRGDIGSLKLGRSRRIPVAELQRFIRERLQEAEG